MEELDPEERKWYLATRLLTNSLTPVERLEWEEIIKDEPFRKEFELISKYWSRSEDLPYLQIDKDQDWKVVLERMRKQTTDTRRVTFIELLRYAAVIAVVLIASVLIWKVATDTDVTNVATIVEAPNGARTLITLPDSSKVWLNAGSKISYNQEFGAENRNITLEGEAFFDVKKRTVPFKVHTALFDITVLGTAFNVNAYDKEDVFSTTLLRGSLKVNRVGASGKGEEVVLKPNERIILRATTTQRMAEAMVLEKNVDAAADADWKDGWLTVRGESLNELSKKIERIYNVKINFKDESLKTYRYNGRIQQLSLEQVLSALALTSPVKFTIHEKNVILSENELTKSKYQSQKP
ncbi:FecR family protein [Chryseosolibacter indicus]|uniref:DUF4974 domain-containing protein n=1 Tax=Chryseosolibacter indicus TaxID=2782351 RepID=A0ABS5VQR9_9BACT|nr:FecR domain-containing protein [Chryseosolibacter indicus]MBT1703795.1 DUF4974 domain-containing protein [Chryseosolibacter indicus]